MGLSTPLMATHDDNMHTGSGRNPLEEYQNHLGAVDNFTETSLAGGGTQTPSAANHYITLNNTAFANGSAAFQTKKAWTLGSTPIITNYMPAAIALTRNDPTNAFVFGMANTFANLTSQRAVFIGRRIDAATEGWYAQTIGPGGTTETQVATGVDGKGGLLDGDRLTISATYTSVVFYRNGTVVATHTTNIPTDALKAGAASNNPAAEAQTQAAALDNISLKVFV